VTRHDLSVPAPDRPCPNCGSNEFKDGRCARCRRPRIEEPAYLDGIESLAWQVVNAAYDEYGASAEEWPGTPAAMAIGTLARHLRHWHYDGDGCIEL
jgi:hypothetical protein